MDLSREAMIKLRPLAATQEEWQSPTLSWVGGSWKITHASRNYRGKKNVRISLSAAADQKSYTVELSHQDAQTLKIETSASEMTPSDLSEKDGTASCFVLPNSSSLEVLAWGNEGQLSDWMTEDGGWIVDSAGERRPDWRKRYVVVRINEGETFRVEVWASGPLTSETIEKIKDAMQRARVDGDLLPLTIDDGRDKDDKEKWLKASGQDCADLDSSGPDEEKSRCRCM
ncbi:hypothetical protein QBC42DRAFT_345990 [Cladorrhinum samala]|uniref:Uncharacterized protein n=1 Tax=Cladorrhinum samala TaxID=585594 RepID=A0AAV9HPR0_9PEZI|nr:hypothetical protein QBC42DRAFT_345990 [Cladorrhinum samala]